MADGGGGRELGVQRVDRLDGGAAGVAAGLAAQPLGAAALQWISSRLSAWGVPLMSSLLHFGQAIKAMRFPFVRWVRARAPAGPSRLGSSRTSVRTANLVGGASPSVSCVKLPRRRPGAFPTTSRDLGHGATGPPPAGVPIRTGKATDIRDPVAGVHCMKFRRGRIGNGLAVLSGARPDVLAGRAGARAKFVALGGCC